MLECWCALIGVYRASACAIASKTSCACTELRPCALVPSGLTSCLFVPSYLSLRAPVPWFGSCSILPHPTHPYQFYRWSNHMDTSAGDIPTCTVRSLAWCLLLCCLGVMVGEHQCRWHINVHYVKNSTHT